MIAQPPGGDSTINIKEDTTKAPAPSGPYRPLYQNNSPPEGAAEDRGAAAAAAATATVDASSPASSPSQGRFNRRAKSFGGGEVSTCSKCPLPPLAPITERIATIAFQTSLGFIDDQANTFDNKATPKKRGSFNEVSYRRWS